MLTRLLVPVRGDGMAPSVLAHAARLARRHKAHMQVVHCRMKPADLMPRGAIMPSFARKTMVEQATTYADREEDHLRAALHSFAEDSGLDEGPPRPGKAATCEMVEESGQMADIVTHNGRLADLIVLAKPQRERNLGHTSLKSALYDAGRPVLLCPPDAPARDELGARIAVGWNGSLPAARAVMSTLDLARMAQSVDLLAIGKGEPHGPDADELATYYALRGVETRTHRFEAKSVARGLLEKAGTVGADMLIVGAYSRSQGSEMLWGGDTQAIIDATGMPVVLVH